MSPQTGLADSLLKLRAGEKDHATRLFESGPSLHIERLHSFKQLVLAATAKYVEEALERVSRQQKLSTLGQVAGMISHELRNPLGTIRTSVYSLGMREENKSPEARKVLDRIERSILRCDAIVASLLDYIREPQLQLESHNLLEWTLELLAEQELPPHIRLQPPDTDVGDVSFDAELLRRASLNVVSNARHAIEAAEAARGSDTGGILAISLLSREDQVGIEFRDDGTGISSEYQGRVFEPLFSTKSFGIGLGMLIVQQIIKQHAGVVEIQSKANVGTRVVLWLPANNKTGRTP